MKGIGDTTEDSQKHQVSYHLGLSFLVIVSCGEIVLNAVFAFPWQYDVDAIIEEDDATHD